MSQLGFRFLTVVVALILAPECRCDTAPEAVPVEWARIPAPPGHAEAVWNRIGGKGPVHVLADGAVVQYDGTWKVLPPLIRSGEDVLDVAINDEGHVALLTAGGCWRHIPGRGWVRLEGLPAESIQLIGVADSFLLLGSRTLWKHDGKQLEEIYRAGDDVVGYQVGRDDQPAVYVIENRRRLKRFGGRDRWLTLRELPEGNLIDLWSGSIRGKRGRVYLVYLAPAITGHSRVCEVLAGGRASRIARDGIVSATPIGDKLLVHFADLHLELLGDDGWTPVTAPRKIGTVVALGGQVYAIEQGWRAIFTVAYGDLSRSRRRGGSNRESSGAGPVPGATR